MSGFLNRVQLIGNLGRDPEARTMQNGGQVVTLSIATTESWKDDRSGERRERTEWHRVVIFNDGLGKIAERHSGLKLIVDHMGVPRASNGEAAYRFQPEFACIRTCTAVLIRIARPSG